MKYYITKDLKETTDHTNSYALWACKKNKPELMTVRTEGFLGGIYMYVKDNSSVCIYVNKKEIFTKLFPIAKTLKNGEIKEIYIGYARPSLFPKLLAQFFGADAKTGASGPYTHTITEASPLKWQKISKMGT